MTNVGTPTTASTARQFSSGRCAPIPACVQHRRPPRTVGRYAQAHRARARSRPTGRSNGPPRAAWRGHRHGAPAGGATRRPERARARPGAHACDLAREVHAQTSKYCSIGCKYCSKYCRSEQILCSSEQILRVFARVFATTQYSSKYFLGCGGLLWIMRGPLGPRGVAHRLGGTGPAMRR